MLGQETVNTTIGRVNNHTKILICSTVLSLQSNAGLLTVQSALFESTVVRTVNSKIFDTIKLHQLSNNAKFAIILAIYSTLNLAFVVKLK